MTDHTRTVVEEASTMVVGLRITKARQAAST